MNGIALHGGYRPVRRHVPGVLGLRAQRAAHGGADAAARASSCYTHDSIGLGEDGPTHQPVEHVASACALIPNMDTLAAVRHGRDGGRLGAPRSSARTARRRWSLTRQALPQQARTPEQLAAIARGGYVLIDSDGRARVHPDRDRLGSRARGRRRARARGSAAGACASCRCRAPACSTRRTRAYRDEVLPPRSRAALAIEAGVPDGWWRYVGPRGRVIGIDRFGASGTGQGPVQAFRFHRRRRRRGGRNVYC